MPLNESSFAEETSEYKSASRVHMIVFHAASADIYACADSNPELKPWLRALSLDKGALSEPEPVAALTGSAPSMISQPKRSESVSRRAEVIKAASQNAVPTIYDVVNLAKAKQQALFTCGAGEAGQLCLGLKQTSGQPNLTECTSLKGRMAPREVSMGLKHTVCITVNDGLAVCGSNSHGQLGIAGLQGTLRPQLLASLRRVKVRYAACGANHSLVSDEYGNAYAWGSNCCFQCAAGSAGQRAESVSEPLKLPNFGVDSADKVRCDRVFAGPASSAATDVMGCAWVWGLNESGQLGLGFIGNGLETTHGIHHETDMKVEFKQLDSVARPEFCVQWPTQVHSFSGMGVLQVAMAINFTLWRLVPKSEFMVLDMELKSASYAQSVTSQLPAVAPARGMDARQKHEAVLYISGRPGRGFYAWQDWQQLVGIDTSKPYTDPVFGEEPKCSHISCGVTHGCIISRGRIFSIGNGALGLVEENGSNHPLPNAPDRYVGPGEAYESVPAASIAAIAEMWFSGSIVEDKYNEEVRRGGWPGGVPHMDGPGLAQVAFHPMLCTTLQLEGIDDCACGMLHTVAKSKGGRVFSFGSNSEGQLATGTFVGLLCPSISTAGKQIEGRRTIALAAGGSSSAALAVRGHTIFESTDRRLAKAAALHWWGKVQARLCESSEHRRRRLSMFVQDELQGVSIEDLGIPKQAAAAAATGTEYSAAPSTKGCASEPAASSDIATSTLDEMVGSMLDAEGLQVPHSTAPGAEWSEHITEHGMVYFYNSITGESTWEKPPELS